MDSGLFLVENSSMARAMARPESELANAVLFGKLDVVKRLCTPENVNEIVHGEGTLLAKACWYIAEMKPGDYREWNIKFEIVKTLLERGARLDIVVPTFFESPLLIAAKTNNVTLGELLFKYIDSPNGFFVNNNRLRFEDYVDACCNKEFRDLVRRSYFNGNLGQDINRRLDYYGGKTLLHIAVEYKNLRAIRDLVEERRIKRDIKDKAGLTALDYAKKMYDRELLEAIEPKIRKEREDKKVCRFCRGHGRIFSHTSRYHDMGGFEHVEDIYRPCSCLCVSRG